MSRRSVVTEEENVSVQINGISSVSQVQLRNRDYVLTEARKFPVLSNNLTKSSAVVKSSNSTRVEYGDIICFLKLFSRAMMMPDTYDFFKRFKDNINRNNPIYTC